MPVTESLRLKRLGGERLQGVQLNGAFEDGQ